MRKNYNLIHFIWLRNVFRLYGPIGDKTDVELAGSLYLSTVALHGRLEVPSQLKVHWEAGGWLLLGSSLWRHLQGGTAPPCCVP